MDKKKSLPWWENYLGFSWERLQRRNTWRTVFSYFGYSTALPFFLTANPMIGPVRPSDVLPHIQVQNKGTQTVAVVFMTQRPAGAHFEAHAVCTLSSAADL